MSKNCPYCGQEILDVARKCKYCGKWLSQQQITTTQKTESDTVKCPYCYSEISSKAKKCPNCGEWLERKKNKSYSYFTAVFLTCECIVSLLVGGFFGMLLLGEAGIGLSFVYMIITIIIWNIYFLPTEIANSKKHRKTTLIFILNIIFGATFIGWIALLIWAFNDN